jgi:hypothetical protein
MTDTSPERMPFAMRFAARQTSTAPDSSGVTYDARLQIAVTVVPTGVRRRVSAFMRHFGLTFGAFDFIVTPEGAWRFLEVNSNGQWHWIEQETGVPIARSIADLLEKGRTDDRYRVTRRSAGAAEGAHPGA